MNLGKETRERTRTTPANSSFPNSGLRRATLPPPACLPLLLQAPASLPLPPPTAGDPQGGNSRRWWWKNEEKKEGKEEKEKRQWWRKFGKLHFHPISTTNHTQALNFHSIKPLLSLGQATQLRGVRNKTTKDTQTPTHHRQQGMIFQK